MVHRVFRGLDPGGEADRAHRLPARAGGGPWHHGAGHARHGPGLPSGLVRDHAHRPVRDRERHHPASGRRQPLRGCGRAAGDRPGAPQPRPGVQLVRHDPGAFVRRLPDPRPLRLGQRRGRRHPQPGRAARRCAVRAAPLPDRGGDPRRARRGDRPLPAARHRCGRRHEARRQGRARGPVALAPPQPRFRRAGDLHLPDRRDRRVEPVHQLRLAAGDRQPHAYGGVALPVPALGWDDGRPLRRQLPDAGAVRRDRPGRRRHRGLHGDAGGDLRDGAAGDVGADLRWGCSTRSCSRRSSPWASAASAR